MGSGHHNYDDSYNDHDDPRDGIVDYSALVRSPTWTMMMMMMLMMMMMMMMMMMWVVMM